MKALETEKALGNSEQSLPRPMLKEGAHLMKRTGKQLLKLNTSVGSGKTFLFEVKRKYAGF